MRLVLAFLLVLVFSTTSYACIRHESLSKMDLTFAEVVFEGDIHAVKPILFFNKHLKKEQVSEMELIFNVETVIRGELNEDRITVGWLNGPFGYPKNLEEFTNSYGKTLRVALTTPKQVLNHCEMRMRHFSRGEKSFQEPHWSCSVDYNGFNGERAKEIPFVLNSSCTGPYMHSVNEGTDVLELAPSIAYQIAQNYSDTLKPGFESDISAQQFLVDVAWEQSSWLHNHLTGTKKEEYKEFFEKTLLRRLKFYSTLFGIDRDFRDRVLTSDSPF